MLASELVDILNGELIGEDFAFDRIAFNSSECDRGTLFVALKGSKTHGVKFAEDALKHGAVGLLTDVVPVEGSYILVDDTFEALKKIGTSLSANYKGKIVAVLGASGKTTLKELLKALSPLPVWSSNGNRNTIISLVTDLFNDRQDAMSKPYWILEFGIHEPKDAQDFLEIFKPYAALFASLGAEHLEYLKDVQTAVETNMKIGKAARKLFAMGSNEYEIPGAVKFGSDESLYKFVISEFTCDGFTEGTLICDGIRRSLALPFWGKRSCQSVAGAVAFWHEEGFDVDQLPWSNLNSINIWGRQQLTRWNDLLIFFDAYNANPESMREFLEVVKDVPYDRKGLVIGDMLELGKYSEYWHRVLAHWLKNARVQYLVLVGDEVRFTLEELDKIGGNPIYVEWYRDVDTAKQFFLLPDDLELLGLKGSRRVALEKLIQEVSEVES